jgi:hypothetical protein
MTRKELIRCRTNIDGVFDRYDLNGFGAQRVEVSCTATELHKILDLLPPASGETPSEVSYRGRVLFAVPLTKKPHRTRAPRKASNVPSQESLL